MPPSVLRLVKIHFFYYCLVRFAGVLGQLEKLKFRSTKKTLNTAKDKKKGSVHKLECFILVLFGMY